MTMYFDFKVNVRAGSLFSCVEWHQQLPLLAVGFRMKQPVCTYVYVYDHMGEALPDLNELYQENNENTALSWHPNKKILIAGFYSGDILLWNGQPEFTSVPSAHSSPIKFFRWSTLGTRLVSMEQTGALIGWKVDNRGIILRVFQCNITGLPTSISFCCCRPGLDMSSLAKKAVAGDEKALDIFSAWRPKTGSYRPTFTTDNLSCYVAVFPDKIYYINETGNALSVANCEHEINYILHNLKKDLLIVILNDASVNQYSTSSNGSLQNISKVKLNDANVTVPFIWIEDDLLACATREYAIRFLDIQTGNTYLLNGIAEINEKQIFTTISYMSAKGVLCGGSNKGNITMWKKNNSVVGGNEWTEVSIIKMKDTIIYSTWGSQNAAILTTNSLFILQEHKLCACYNKQVGAVQRTANEVTINQKNETIKLNTDLKIIGVFVSEEHVAVWSGKTVAVYKFTDSTTLNVLGTFSCECDSLLIYEQSLVILPNSVILNGKLLISTFQGTVKQNLDSDGQPIAVHLNKSYLITATIIGVVQIWDLSRREAKLHVHPKDLIDAIPDFGEVVMVRINSTGTIVSLTIANSNLIPSSYIYVWDVETDSMISYQFENANKQAIQNSRYITNHYWDAEEPYLLVCETKINDDVNYTDEKSKLIDDYLNFPMKVTEDSTSTKLVTLFVSKENGIVVQDRVPMSSTYLNLLGVDVPYLIILKKSYEDKYACMEKLLMNYFDEISANNKTVRNAIIKFSFSLSVGNLDDAYKTIRNINNVSVWNNLTKMCIKKKRLDVARICLGNMNDARGVSVLRNLPLESSLEVKLAALAIHMEMFEDAENLYTYIERYDLLNKMYQNASRWDEALRIAESKDRIHLKNTYNAYGRYLEEKGEIQEAIKMYELANTHRKHIPRLLLNNPVTLEKYIQKSKDPLLMKWWAQYVESTRNMELAMKYYEEAKDYLSVVRILCFLENSDQATEIANRSNDPAACYHLARHYENLGQIEKAVHFFIKSNASTNAIRICKENGLDDQLWQISMQAGQREKLEVGKYFENVDPYKAVMLYHKAGNYQRALCLAFRYDLCDSVELISSELDITTQSELLEKCADYFLKKENFDVAVKLLAGAKKFKEAVTVCQKRRIVLTEELADLLTPPADYASRVDILNQLGEHGFFLGNYHLAAKKFMQAGNKTKAMKALLKSGDTEKIIFFANVSREKEIYIMAANYLQTLNWQAQPDLLKHIINFYTKGKAPHLLANFYIACAQIEVDEYGNYEKSIGALNEASRCLSKDPDQYGQALEYIAKKSAMVKKFLEIRRQFEKGEDDAAMLQARKLLSSELDLVRRGDIYSLMVEHLIKNNDWNSAVQTAIEMKKNLPNDNLAYYIPKETLMKMGIENIKTEEKKSDLAFDEIEDIT